MAKTSTFSLRVTREVRETIEKNAEILRMKPSVLAAMVLRDCTEKWVKDYSEEIFEKLHKSIDQIGKGRNV